MSTSSLLLMPRIHSEFLVIIFDRPENRSRRSCGRLEETVERRADYFILTTSSEKKLQLNCIKKRKKYRKFVKMTFSCGNYNIFTLFSSCLPETRTKDHIRGPRTIENGRLFSNSKQNIYVWNLKLQDYREEHKSYLQGVFQLVT